MVEEYDEKTDVLLVRKCGAQNEREPRANGTSTGVHQGQQPREVAFFFLVGRDGVGILFLKMFFLEVAI